MQHPYKSINIMNIQEIKHRFYELKGARDILISNKEESLKTIKNLTLELDLLEKCSAVFEKLLDISLKEKLKKMDELVTYGLKTVIEDQSLDFKSVPTQKRDRLWVDLNTVTEEGVEGNAIDMCGGGVAAIESYLLRNIVIVQNKLKRFMYLDEPFKQISVEYVPLISSLCKELSKKLDMDILVISHTPGIIDHADRIYRASKDNGKLKLKRER
jgi:DNA repair exonuclease SbcCD ATPase subunit